MDDILTLDARKVLNALGNAGATIQWYAVRKDGTPLDPATIGDDAGDIDPHSFVVTWPDESAARITVADTPDPYDKTGV